MPMAVMPTCWQAMETTPPGHPMATVSHLSRTAPAMRRLYHERRRQRYYQPEQESGSGQHPAGMVAGQPRDYLYDPEAGCTTRYIAGPIAHYRRYHHPGAAADRFHPAAC